MAIRGRRSHSAVRRLITTPASARPTAAAEHTETPLIDADRLIASLRVRAYAEARQRQRRAAAPEAAAHWGQVANLIARRTSEQRGDGPIRTELDANVASGGAAVGVRPAVRFFEVDPVEELERVLAARPQRFRLQFFGLGADHGPTVLTETEIQAADASVAIREAVTTSWPPRAVGLRLLDLEGREIFERLKADLR
ncbi:MAG: hypothetical protein WA397_00155 [Roseiarcus sp.]